ncbi:MAG: hypothetical protein C6I01_06160 [Epsilonproteobacteria bacterium]|nr:hypothetical protein [Campylobacterota bacterium]
MKPLTSLPHLCPTFRNLRKKGNLELFYQLTEKKRNSPTAEKITDSSLFLWLLSINQKKQKEKFLTLPHSSFKLKILPKR